MDQEDGSGFSSFFSAKKNRKEKKQFSKEKTRSETKMPVSNLNTHYYNMSHKSRGLLYIFNHTEYKNFNEAPRQGSEIDCEKIKRCFRDLDFIVMQFDNLTLCDIQNHIRHLCTDIDHTDCDCLAIFILSRGNIDRIAAFDEEYDPDIEIFTKFTADSCPTLAGKPKLFFLLNADGGSGLILHLPRTEFDGKIKSYRIPSVGDWLIVFCTGCYAFQNPIHGSYFVTALCEEFQEKGHDRSILTLLTFVNHRLAVECESKSEDKDVHAKEQPPLIKSCLTRLLVFTKKE